ncbi:MAG: adenylate/guanylate cyclase domain-containing protein, partial [Pirellulaceae bacterium]
MPELIAQGQTPENRWRRRLVDGHTQTLGRVAGRWSVAWDDQVSRQHASLTLTGGALHVTRLAGAQNPVYFQGEIRERCAVHVGQHFVIGSTTFTLVDDPLTIHGQIPLMTEHTFSPEHIRQAAFQDADRRIDALSRLPEVIPSDSSDEELCTRLVHFLLAGVPRAEWAAVVSWQDGEQEPRTEVIHWDSRTAEGPPVTFSEDLIRQALREGCPVAHVWDDALARAQVARPLRDRWAFCTPLFQESGLGWCLYVAGGAGRAGEASRDARELQDDVKFTELVADLVGRLRELRRLERRQAALGQFLSPAVLDRLSDEDPERLFAPREVEVSVLFCDLRGFSRVSEESAQDLMGLLERVSRALSVMTRRILEHGGVVGDFHGDAAMGFWGWPLPQPDRLPRVCQAALAIQADFARAARDPEHPLANFRVGMGVATGKAVAGSIGSSDQVKVTVFGPVVNLAARLQELTKTLSAPIVIDAATAAAVRSQVSREAARVRRLATVRPRGLKSAVEIHQLLPPRSENSRLADEHLAAYELALDALQSG